MEATRLAGWSVGAEDGILRVGVPYERRDLAEQVALALKTACGDTVRPELGPGFKPVG